MNNDTLEYEEFKKEFTDGLRDTLGPYGITTEPHMTVKVNKAYDSLTLKYPESCISPVIYIEEKYEEYRTGGKSIGELVKETAEGANRTMDDGIKVPEISAASAKENLYCAVIGREGNGELLAKVPHEDLQDLAVIARVAVGDTGSFIATNDYCSALKFTPEEVLEMAHANDHKQGYTCMAMRDMMVQTFIEEGMPESQARSMVPEGGPQIYVMTNAVKRDGAAAIASKEAMAEAYGKVGEAFYVLPSSRHEVLLLPASTVNEVEPLRDMVRSINRTEVSEEDRLSDSVYYYDGRSLSIAEDRTMEKSMVCEETLSRGRKR